MDRDQRVDGCDLEHTEDPRIGSDDAQAALFFGEPAGRRNEYAHAGRVEERALGEIHHHGIGRGRERRKWVLELRRRREVELPRYAHDRGAARQELATEVKIVNRVHGGRV